jgi:hypothetical protein
MRFAGNKIVKFNFPDDEDRIKYRERLEAENDPYNYDPSQDPYNYNEETMSEEVWNAINDLEKLKKANQVDYYDSKIPIETGDIHKTLLDLRTQEVTLAAHLLNQLVDRDESNYIQKVIQNEIKNRIANKQPAINKQQDILNKLEGGIARDVPVTHLMQGKRKERDRLHRIKAIKHLLKPENKLDAYDHMRSGDLGPGGYWSSAVDAPNLNIGVKGYREYPPSTDDIPF